MLYPLSLVLNRVLDEDGELAELFEGRIVNIFYLFSQAENHVKEMVADRMVLKRKGFESPPVDTANLDAGVLKDLKRMSPVHQITMLKFIKNLSMLSTTLDALQNSNAIDVLADLLSSSMKEPHFREISNQVLNTMYNLCRLSKTRQEDAALNGIIPLLLRIVKTERPLKEFALPILCDMAHSGKIGRKILWQNKGLPFYISLLSDPYWQVTALDAIFIWYVLSILVNPYSDLHRLQEETAKVEEHLLDGAFTEAIVKCFTTSKANAFENLLEPLQKLLRLSPPVAQSLARPDLFSRILQKLRHHKAVIRLNLLRIVRSICDSGDDHDELIRRHGLFEAIQRLAENDSAVLVRNMASELVKSSLEKEKQSGSAGRRQVLRRANSNSSSPPLTTSSSVPSTPKHGRSAQSTIYYDAREKRPRNGMTGPISFRPTSREGGTSTGSIASNSSSGSSMGKSRLPRTSMPRLSRSVTAVPPDKVENTTPSGTSSSALHARRRR